MPHRSVSLASELVAKVEKRIEEEFDSRPSKPSISAYIENLVWPVIEGDEIMKQYGPMLQKLSVDSDKVMIQDNLKGRIAELTFRDNVLWCSLDDSDECLHVGFAWSIPAVYRVLMSRGQKKPPTRR